MTKEELKYLRKSKHMTQSDLAEAIGMNRATVNKMECGDAPIEKRTGLAIRYILERVDAPAISRELVLQYISENLK